MRWLFCLLLLLLGLGLAASGAQASRIQGPVRVIDGDTFVLDGRRIRLHGVDAPERAQICRDARGHGWACGDWAGQVLGDLLRPGHLVCHDLGERSHDRIVARCDLDGRDLAAGLIERGVVRACPRYADRHPHSRRYVAIEAAAIAARRGLHAGTTPPLARFCQTATPPPGPATVADGCRIKGNIGRDGARIYHLPGQRDYDATVISPARGERWFCSEAEARAAGWRPARR